MYSSDKEAQNYIDCHIFTVVSRKESRCSTFKLKKKFKVIYQSKENLLLN